MNPEFVLTMRGYDREAVDRVVRTALSALASPDRTVRFQAAETLRTVQFARRLRGYHRDQVDDWVRTSQAALSS